MLTRADVKKGLEKKQEMAQYVLQDVDEKKKMWVYQPDASLDTTSAGGKGIKKAQPLSSEQQLEVAVEMVRAAAANAARMAKMADALIVTLKNAEDAE